jgi:hypothetical protein
VREVETGYVHSGAQKIAHHLFGMAGWAERANDFRATLRIFVGTRRQPVRKLRIQSHSMLDLGP